MRVAGATRTLSGRSPPAAQTAPALLGQGVAGEQVVLGLGEKARHRGRVVARRAATLARPLARIGCWARPVAEHVAQNVHGAALPAAAEHRGDGGLSSRTHPTHGAEPPKATGPHRVQEPAPEGLGLGFADTEADHLPAAGLLDDLGDPHAFVTHPAGRSDALHLGIEPEVGVAVLQGAL